MVNGRIVGTMSLVVVAYIATLHYKIQKLENEYSVMLIEKDTHISTITGKYNSILLRDRNAKQMLDIKSSSAKRLYYQFIRERDSNEEMHESNTTSTDDLQYDWL